MTLFLADRFSAERASLVTRRVFACRLIGTAALTTTFGFTAGRAVADDRAIFGNVRKRRPVAGATFGEGTRLLLLHDKVFRNDVLWTRNGGQLQVAMIDGSTLSLGENAKVVLNDSLSSNTGSSFLHILGGAFCFNSGKAEQPAAPPKIETPFATLSLRGTEVFGGRFDKSYGIFVSKGEVEVRNDAGAITLNAGRGTSLTTRNVPPTQPEVWSDAKVKRARALAGE
ncbi:FecR family protein [Dongia soli]|uniref:FecR family protein n=1 Tax=Dongia soli TaxID=600628 RepID=A0ABU5EHD6_9PROT|nr:FecR family protein [Dongia soli]MDY0885781.1 FecR family protein [Dongia soli]